MSRPGAGVTGMLALASLALAAPLAAQSTQERIRPSPEPIELHRLTGPITLDGVVDEPAWEAIPPLQMMMYAPIWDGEPTQETEIRIGYDDTHLYMSGRLYEEDSSLIRTNTFYRDQFSGDDLLSILIDSYNDYETALWFVTNPAGARSDRTMSNDAEFTGAGMPMNSDWNSHWDVTTRTTEEGWFAEFRIPFSTLGFQQIDDTVTMGIIVYRYFGRNTERQLFPSISQEWGGFGFGKPSQAQRVTLSNVTPSTPIYMTPYLLGGLTQLPLLAEPPDVTSPEWQTDNDRTGEIGVDFKYSPTSNIALDLTVNTDFAQVEADDQQINLTRFPLFFPEKRQFFQERASTFDFSTGGFTDRLFFSRQIGLDQGEIVRIYGGVRGVGRAGGMDFGVLNMQTADLGDRSGENMGVVRLSQKVFNPYSNVGGMLTTRFGSNGEDNIAYGLDTQLRLFGDEYLTVKWAQTFDEAIEEGSALDAGLIRATWDRRRDRGLSYNLQYGRVGTDYLPRLGFQLRDDFSLYGGRIAWGWFPGPRSPFQTITLAANTSHYYRNEDGTAETRSYRPEFWLEWKTNASIRGSVNTSFESIRQSFSVAGIPIPVGDYWFTEGNINLSLSRSALFRGMVGLSAGTFYDGTRRSISIDPAWNVSRYLELSGGYGVNWLDFSERDQQETTHLGRLRGQLALNVHLSLNAFLQYNSLSKQTSLNARFRYHFREGTDLWIVYNEGYNHSRDGGVDPRLPLSAGRSVMVKYTHTFTF
ncbi:MAG: carbohydrate binding family 9 domain-containing protein [Gemmatimonadota bacterium]|nr:carbohydrate binding family 9 domain-containing protein [Gemmatimonadota bacterium]